MSGAKSAGDRNLLRKGFSVSIERDVDLRVRATAHRVRAGSHDDQRILAHVPGLTHQADLLRLILSCEEVIQAHPLLELHHEVPEELRGSPVILRERDSLQFVCLGTISGCLGAVRAQALASVLPCWATTGAMQALIQGNCTMPERSTPCIRLPKNRGSQRVDSRDAKSASSDNCSGCPRQKRALAWPLPSNSSQKPVCRLVSDEEAACLPWTPWIFRHGRRGMDRPAACARRARVGVSDAVRP